MNRRFVATLICAVLWAASPGVRADPTLRFGVAGALRPLSGSSRHVRLVEHEVRVRLPERRVEVRSVLRNEGPAATVLVALPERGSVGPGAFPLRGFLSGHESFVDGRRVAVSRFLPRGEPGRWERDYELLWLRRARFGRGQTRILRDVFTSGRAHHMMNAPEAGYRQLFSYGLRSAAKWKGPIGRLRVVFDVSGGRDFSELRFDFAGFERTGAKLVWERRDVEPRDDLGASWWPGVKRITLNGEEVMPRCVVVSPTSVQGEFAAVYPRKRGGTVWVPLRLLKEWLPPAPDGFESGLAQGEYRPARSLNRGARNLSVEIGSRFIDVVAPNVHGSQTRVPMSAPAWEQSGLTMIELAPAVRALGGSITWDVARQRAEITLR